MTIVAEIMCNRSLKPTPGNVCIIRDQTLLRSEPSWGAFWDDCRTASDKNLALIICTFIDNHEFTWLCVMTDGALGWVIFPEEVDLII